MAYPYPRRRFPNPPSVETATGGACSFFHAAAHLNRVWHLTGYEAMRMCGGPHETFVLRQPIEESTE